LSALKLLSRTGLAGLAAVAAFALLAYPAMAAPKTAEKTKAEKTKEDGKPALVATFGAWNVFTGRSAKGKICYTLAQPKSREPASLTRDPGYAFISDRPAEGVRNEVSFIMGFDVSSGALAEADKTEAKPAKGAAKTKTRPIPSPVAVADDVSFDLLPKGGNLWVKNAARESALIAQMKSGVTLLIKAYSVKGNASTDTYPLDGFSQAMDRLQKECSGKP
jgi:invasion protein IalB